MIAKVTVARRSIERLKGLLEGIAIDNEITTPEITGIYNWMQEYSYLHDIYPFKETMEILDRILKDGVVTDCEKEEILEWCCQFCEGGMIDGMYTTAIRRLHGLVHGIIIDSIITDGEISDLNDWLLDYENFQNHWPFCEVYDIVSRVLEDNLIDDQERKELHDFCNEFSERVITDQYIHDKLYKSGFMKTDAPILQPISYLCEKPETLTFYRKSFCFTGPAKTGPRWKLEEMVEELGGCSSDRVTQNLDFLVIGAKSSPAWAYSTYGRKVEAAMNNRKNGYYTIIITEETFLENARLTKNFCELS